MLKLNGAGGAATDPVLAGLTLAAIGYADSFNLAKAIRLGIDVDTGYPIVTDLTAGLTPQASQVTPAGLAGVWDNVAEVFTIGSTTGLQVGHFMRLNAGVTYVTARVKQIVSATEVRFEQRPFNANVSNVAYQVAWAYIGTAGQGSLTSAAAGVVHYFKFEGQTSAGNPGQLNPQAFYIADAPNDLLRFNGGAASGWRTNDLTPTFDVLPSWPSKGGIGSLALTQAAGITWWDDALGEKYMYEVVAQGGGALKLTPGDGAKSAQIVARGVYGSTFTRVLGDVSGTLDTMAPAVSGEVVLL